jgi:hypothetical protein
MFNVQGAKTEDTELEQSAEQDSAGPTHSIDANFLKDVNVPAKFRESSSRFV